MRPGLLASLALAAAAVVSGSAWPAPVAAASATVTISDALSPAEVTIAPGETVTWRNSDGERHRMRSTSGPGDFDTNDIEPGRSVTMRFNAAGTYSYQDERDRENPRYHGRVVVRSGQPAEPAPPTASPPPASVSIVDRAFSPSSVSVAAGGTVTWTNNDDRSHTATADNGAFGSSTLSGGGRFSHTFPAPGTFAYFCELHPEMRGVVSVGQAGGGATPVPPPPPATPAGGGAPAGPSNVRITDNAFSPAALEVAVGTTVTWVNNGRARHTVTGPAFDSGDLGAGGRFSHTFTTTGAFAYRCDIHPEMRGVIGVGGAPPPVAPAPAGRAPTAAPPGKLSVNVADYSFQPAQVTAAVGDTVTWRNVGAAPHTATAGDGTFDSGTMAPGAGFERVFTAEGTSAYFCAIHPEMTGVVNVGAAPPGGAPPAAEASPPAAAAGDAKAMSATVKLKDYRFDPERLTVGVGAEVTFKHEGRAPHTATTKDGLFDSGELDNGGTYKHTFARVGRYEYICELHPRMRGVIEVIADRNAKPVGTSSSGFGLEHIAFASIAGAPLLFIGSAILNGWRSK